MIIRPALLVLALAASSLAWGETPDLTPLRIVRLSYAEGPLAHHSATDAAVSALPDRPLRAGDSLTTGHAGRAEVAFGNATLRLDENTAISLVALGTAIVRVQLTTGTAIVHLRDLFEEETIEVVTPNATITLDAPGEYRFDVSSDDATELTVRNGVAEVATGGEPVRVADGQRVRLAGREAIANLAAPLPADAFDEWVLEREVQFAQTQPPPRESSDGNDDQALDPYGEWHEEESYGRVWMPSYAYGGHDPFGYGHWQRSGYGWSWIEPLPWGAYTFHRGRWAYLRDRNRWCWVPSRDDHRRRDVDERAPVAEAPRTPIRFEGDRVPTYRGDAGTGKTPTRAAPAPRPAAPASAGDAPTTMRPTRSVEARSSTESRPTSTMKGSPRTVEP